MSKKRFDDPDLHTPAHDAIMLWLDENAARLIHEILVADVQRNSGIEVRQVGVITEWEKPHAHMARSHTAYGKEMWREAGRYFIDMLITSWASEEDVNRPYAHIKLACEVKPVIHSVGELIRQLRQYESKNWRVAVVSPDDRYREIIERQGFIFIKAPQPEYGPQGGLF
jgi:hypothetical protein